MTASGKRRICSCFSRPKPAADTFDINATASTQPPRATLSSSTVWHDARSRTSMSRASLASRSILKSDIDSDENVDPEIDLRLVKSLSNQRRYLEACHVMGRCLRNADDTTAITKLPIFEQLCKNMDGFFKVMGIVDACSRPDGDADPDSAWIHVPLKNDKSTQLYWRKMKNPKKVEFQFHTIIDAPLGDVMCNCAEVDTWDAWNKMVKKCQLIDSHKYGLDFCLHFGKWLTFSVAATVCRFIDPKNGFVLEYSYSQTWPDVEQDGIKLNLSSYQILIPTTNAQGKSVTMLVQIISTPLPNGVPVPNWFLSWGAKTGVPDTIKELNEGSKKLRSDPRRFARRQEDKTGLYAMLDELEKKFCPRRKGVDRPAPGKIPANILESGKEFKRFYDAFVSGNVAPVITREKSERGKKREKMKKKFKKNRSESKNSLMSSSSNV